MSLATAAAAETMFCFQCQETAKGTGCTLRGVCGKLASTANLQDDLIHDLKRIAYITTALLDAGIKTDLRKSARFVFENLFSTITNANFDNGSFDKRRAKAASFIKALEAEAEAVGLTLLPHRPEEASILSEKDEDVRSLKELTKYGLKGLAAYGIHAYHLGFEDDDIYRTALRHLSELYYTERDLQGLIELVLECGKNGVAVMALLDKAHNETYGHPEITEVNIGVRKNPGILISGHDLHDLKMLLEQTEGTGIDVYTHSEMLPGHYYPELKKYKHLAGNYGNAWWKQREEFETFNGPIVFTTNCIVPPSPKATYLDRVYTSNATGYPGWKRIETDENGHKDFSEVIAQAKTCLPPMEIEHGSITGGFAHHQVLLLADKIVENIKSGAIRKFVVMSGCDGRMRDRDYYTRFAEELPKDAVILTSGCAKYRYNKLGLGDINGIPRVLDAGQCNDSYSLAVIALKLAEVFGAESVNDLPLVFNIAWYEQKAVIVLLALLSLGVKNIQAGPTLPAFFSPNVLKVLSETFGLRSNSTVDEDMVRFGLK